MSRYSTAEDAIDACEPNAAHKYARHHHRDHARCHVCPAILNCQGCQNDCLSAREKAVMMQVQPVVVYWR